eukprot:TRINITY_DN22777_c0_g1_i2.p1 TRINITY_DN22777_c0_g1~~TRINITY_DN22777_c0_g1_i2.p1  ORF type:complete len:196 (+),score=28.42 TRINITY_DN22777_c0_g1_i2:315-902(+)
MDEFGSYHQTKGNAKNHKHRDFTHSHPKDQQKRITTYNKIRKSMPTKIHTEALDLLKETFTTGMTWNRPKFLITSNHCAGNFVSVLVEKDRLADSQFRTFVTITISMHTGVKVYPIDKKVTLVHFYGLSRHETQLYGWMDHPNDWEDKVRGTYSVDPGMGASYKLFTVENINSVTVEDIDEGRARKYIQNAKEFE